MHIGAVSQTLLSIKTCCDSVEDYYTVSCFKSFRSGVHTYTLRDTDIPRSHFTRAACDDDNTAYNDDVYRREQQPFKSRTIRNLFFYPPPPSAH